MDVNKFVTERNKDYSIHYEISYFDGKVTNRMDSLRNPLIIAEHEKLITTRSLVEQRKNQKEMFDVGITSQKPFDSTMEIQ